MGGWYSEALHLSLLISEDPANRSKYLDNLKYWQEESSYMKQLGPYFGLSRDYDIFILSFSPPLIAHLVSLTREYIDVMNYLISLQKEIFYKVQVSFSTPVSLFHSLWLLHMANSSNNSSLYEELRTFINKSGGVPKKYISTPPDNIGLNEEDTDWEIELEIETVHVPNQKELTNLVNNSINSSEDIYTAFDLSIRVFTDNAVNGYWSKHIIKALYTKAP